MGALTHKGRAMVADTLIYSRMRYWAQCMVIPEEIHDAMEADVQGLIWNKAPVFDPDEVGTQVANKRFMKKEAQFRSKSRLGLGLTDWRAHVKGIQIKALIDYKNATRSDYKKILDEWITPNWGGDEVVTYDVKDKANTLRLGNSRDPLPKFWREAVNALEELTLELVTEKSLSREAALREPVWYSHLFNIPDRLTRFKGEWENYLRMREIGDIVTASGEEWTDEEVAGQIREDAEGWTSIDRKGEWVKFPGRRVKVNMATLIKNYRDIVSVIPGYILRAAKGQRRETPGPKGIVDQLYTSG